MAPDADARDDLALMRLFQAGDEVAFEALVRRHLSFVVRHAARYVRDESAAEDVAQEVFLRLYTSKELFRDESNFLGWLATIASRLALNELRTRRRKHWRSPNSRRDDFENAWLPGQQAGQPDSELLRLEEIEAVRAAIDRLPSNQREALWLQRFEGWDLDAVGAALGLSSSAVKSLLFRARNALAAELEAFQAGKSKTPQERAS